MEVCILSRLVLFPGLLSPDPGLTWCKECKHPISVDGEVTRGLWEVGSTGDLPLTASPCDLDCSLVPLDVFWRSLRRRCDLELGLCQGKSLTFQVVSAETSVNIASVYMCPTCNSNICAF
jgi:hypothetical protein